MSKHETFAFSNLLASELPWIRRGEPGRFILDMDDEAQRIGSIEEATRKARVHARLTHREFASWHEAYAVILEELEEFWESIKDNEPDMDELLQVSACCQLAIKELGNTGGERELL